MRGLFAMLFGAGAVLLSERIERRASRTRAKIVFYRRNLWLLAFGLIHGFALWNGDILVDYAILGLVLLYPARRLPAKALLTIGLFLRVVAGGAGLMRVFQVPAAIQARIAVPTSRYRPPPSRYSKRRRSRRLNRYKRSIAATSLAGTTGLSKK